MDLTNFRFETDADGIALADLGHARPLDERHHDQVMDELGQRRRRRRDRRRDQGLRHHLGQGGVLRRRRPRRCSRACRQATMSRRSRRARRGGGDAALLRRLAPSDAALSQARNLRQAVGRGDQRHVPGRRASNSRWPAIIASSRTIRRRASACRRSRSGCSPARAARSASRG